MSVSALISQFNSPSSLSDSPPQTPRSSSYSGRRHYSTGSAGSSRSESPASTESHSPHPDSKNSDDPRVRLGSITEDKIRMFDSRSRSSEGTDGGSPGIKRGAIRQRSYGCVEGGERVEERAGLKPRRQLSAPMLGERGRSPSPFRLPGMPSSSKWEKERDMGEGRRECFHLFFSPIFVCM